jgi:hypothetical protein
MIAAKENAMTRIALMSAAALTLLISGFHSWLGERILIGPLLAAETRRGLLRESLFARRTLRGAWHLTTLFWWAIAGIFAILAADPMAPGSPQDRRILAVLAGAFLATGLLILIGSRGRHLAWPLFLAVAVAAAAPLL